MRGRRNVRGASQENVARPLTMPHKPGRQQASIASAPTSHLSHCQCAHWRPHGSGWPHASCVTRALMAPTRQHLRVLPVSPAAIATVSRPGSATGTATEDPCQDVLCPDRTVPTTTAHLQAHPHSSKHAFAAKEKQPSRRSTKNCSRYSSAWWRMTSHDV